MEKDLKQLIEEMDAIEEGSPQVQALTKKLDDILNILNKLKWHLDPQPVAKPAPTAPRKTVSVRG